MKKVVRSPGSATIINAISPGFGSAFGIGLDIVCNAKTQSHSITCSNDVGADTSLMELCVSNVFDYYGVDADEFGLDIKTTSELPMASGLSSSSALSNAVTAISSKIISEEFNLEPLSDFDIINLAIESSLKAKVTITGAFDDATASYFGGVTVTDNGARKILIKEPMEELPVLVELWHQDCLELDHHLLQYVKKIVLCYYLIVICLKRKSTPLHFILLLYILCLIKLKF